jgi:hypothetical protein
MSTSCIIFLASLMSVYCVQTFADEKFSPSRELNVTSSNRPIENQYPKNFVVIKGTKPADLEIWYAIDFIASNPDCARKALGQMLAGSPGDAPEVYEQVNVPAGKEEFEVSLPIDRYETGRCGWHATSLNQSVYVPRVSSGPVSNISINNIAASGWSEVQSIQECHSTYDEYWKRDRTFCGYGRHSEGRLDLSRNGASLKLQYIFVPVKN